jgi:hypothetical protein
MDESANADCHARITGYSRKKRKRVCIASLETPFSVFINSYQGVKTDDFLPVGTRIVRDMDMNMNMNNCAIHRSKKDTMLNQDFM